MQIETLINELCDLEKQIKELETHKTSLRQEIQELMLGSGTPKFKNERITLSVSNKKGKKKSIASDSVLVEMKKELELEKSEMVSVNKKRIYLLEQAITKHEAELLTLTTNGWTQEMEDKIEERQKELSEQQDPNGENYTLTVRIKK